jgi:hypothetical protein
MNLTSWAIKWAIPYAAVDDLRREMGVVNTDPPLVPGQSESAIQSLVRLEASRLGARLFRNNVGLTHNENGGVIRFGLANDSERLNKRVKSSDLIGIQPVLIGPHHIGQVFGVFLAREVKRPGWCYTGTARERAQLCWLELINSMGGDACFATGEGTIKT